jgi:Flp pilus assembly protein TadG
MSHSSSSRRAQRGLATIEMAIVLPLLLAVLFGVIEYGWLFFKNQQIAGVARVACRFGITAPATTTQTLDKVDFLMDELDLEDSGYTATCSPCEVPSGTFVTVTVTVPYANLQLTGFPLPLPASIIGTTTMGKEGAP